MTGRIIGLVIIVNIFFSCINALVDIRVGLHRQGGMTSFIERLESIEGDQTVRPHLPRRNAATRFIDKDIIVNGPKFPVDLQLTFKEIKVQPGQRIKAYCMSDLHCDAEKNQQWVKEHCKK